MINYRVTAAFAHSVLVVLNEHVDHSFTRRLDYFLSCVLKAYQTDIEPLEKEMKLLNESQSENQSNNNNNNSSPKC